MTLWLSFALLAQVIAQTNAKEITSKVPELVPRFTFEVLNSAEIGRQLINLEDLIGAEAKTVSGMRPAKTVLVLALGMNCDGCEAQWETLNRAHKMGTKHGAKVIGILWASKSKKSELRNKLTLLKTEPIIAWDEYRLSRQRLGLLRKGSALIIRSDGSVDGQFAGTENNAKELLAAFGRALKEGG